MFVDSDAAGRDVARLTTALDATALYNGVIIIPSLYGHWEINSAMLQPMPRFICVEEILVSSVKLIAFYQYYYLAGILLYC